jgi:predicted nucleic acid-binding protein
MMVVDASALLEVLLNTPAAVRFANRLFAPNETLHAPHLIDLEIAQVLRRYTLMGQLDAARGLQALEDLADFPLVRYPHEPFLPRIWQLRNDLTAYDAAYVAPCGSPSCSPADRRQGVGVSIDTLCPGGAHLDYHHPLSRRIDGKARHDSYREMGPKLGFPSSPPGGRSHTSHEHTIR